MSKNMLSPNAASKLTGISRSTIMRALKSGALFAGRDNGNRYQIDPEILKKWAGDRVITVAHLDPVARTDLDMSADHVETKMKLAASEAKVEILEKLVDDGRADREKLLDMITDLSKPRWPWSRRIHRPD